MLLNDRNIIDLCEYPSDKFGPTNEPKCPKCQNWMQNAIPADLPDSRRCASCKHVWEVLKFLPMLEPFSRGVQGGGVVSYGLSHAGYDLRLGQELLVFKNSWNELINPKSFKDEDYRNRVFDKVNPSSGVHHIPKGGYVIPPHSYALGASLEYIRMPRHIKGRCVGKSTYARCGVLINTTPLEPNWHGHLTIEISNISPCPVLIFANEGIAQLEFELLTSEPMIDYEQKDGKYQGQSSSPVPAKVKD